LSGIDDLPGPDELTAYHFLCIAVGSLFLDWANFESSLAAGLKIHLLGRMRSQDRETQMGAARVAAAVYGGQRMKAARDTMKRLAKVEAIDKAAIEFFEDAFAHIGHIEDLRDKLAHQSIQETDQQHVWRLHDIMTTRALAESTFYEINTLAIYYAGLDLKLASQRLSGFLSKDIPFELTPLTWLYKPSMLKLLPRKSGLSPR
jgi:hypothetical protein